MKLASLLVCAGLVALAARAEAQPADAGYRLARSVPLGAPDRWDYVVFDAPSHRVYVAHGDRVSVVDGRDGRRLGEVLGLSGGAHGIAISPGAGKGYTDDGRAGQAVAFDLKTFRAGARIAAAPDADSVTFDRASGHVFVIDGDSEKVTVIDPATDRAIADIAAGGKLETGLSDNQGHVYVNGEEKREIVRIDARTNQVTGHWPIPDCESPHGIALDAADHRLFASCRNGVMAVLDTGTGRQVASAPIGKGTDSAAYDPVRKRVFSSNGADGTISVLQQKSPDVYVALTSVPTAVGARTMALDPATGRLYVAAADLEPPANAGGRPKVRPGSLRLLFLDPLR